MMNREETITSAAVAAIGECWRETQDKASAARTARELGIAVADELQRYFDSIPEVDPTTKEPTGFVSPANRSGTRQPKAAKRK